MLMMIVLALELATLSNDLVCRLRLPRYKAVNFGVAPNDPKIFHFRTTPSAFGTQAQMLCSLNKTGLESWGPSHGVRPTDIPFQCVDSVYTYQLLVSGFGMQPKQVSVQCIGWGLAWGLTLFGSSTSF